MTKKRKVEDLQNDLQGVGKEAKKVNKELDKTEKKFRSIGELMKDFIDGSSPLAKKHTNTYKAIEDGKRADYNRKQATGTFGLLKGIGTRDPKGVLSSTGKLIYNKANEPEPATTAYTNRQRGVTQDIYDASRKLFSKRHNTDMQYDSGKSLIKSTKKVLSIIKRRETRAKYLNERES